MNGTIATNRKAFRDFEVLESFECGIALMGGEVKSLRDKRISLDESFARIEKNRVILYSANITPYEQASYLKSEPTRQRFLLLHKAQILRLQEKMGQKGLALVPLKMYFNSRGYAKVELALCKGKKQFDHRQDIKKRDTDMFLRRQMKNRAR
ncbi:MAG TPA: SsrA-binding protein SmpB [Candidatus Omnitrophota bacterium]|nr:SsrA-binding protein SmpB [Candidatus Omnitrophota bacterium]HPT07328.1 SsrA-binding protein SmpB [Candidatus Omnitrophota bacterium]